MTTAFKMNERLPYYGGFCHDGQVLRRFRAQFDFIRRDSANSNIFYYRINERETSSSPVTSIRDASSFRRICPETIMLL